MIGWKYHPNQQKPKKRGSGEIDLKDLSSDLLNENPDESISFGKIQRKKGLADDEEDYEILDETERLKNIIKNKLGEENLKLKLEKMNKKENEKEEKDKDE